MPNIKVLGLHLSTLKLGLSSVIAVVAMVLAFWLSILTDDSIVNPLLTISLVCVPLGILWAIEREISEP
jgi:MFS-type transporter involved in bile tolerance (Atg22 family)